MEVKGNHRTEGTPYDYLRRRSRFGWGRSLKDEHGRQLGLMMMRRMMLWASWWGGETRDARRDERVLGE